MSSVQKRKYVKRKVSFWRNRKRHLLHAKIIAVVGEALRDRKKLPKELVIARANEAIMQLV